MWVICDIETEQLVNPKYLWVVVVTSRNWKSSCLQKSSLF